MPRYTTDDFKPFREYYYIINLVDLRNPQVYPIYFTNLWAAKRAKALAAKHGQLLKYKVLKGKKIMELDLKYTIKLGRIQRFTKYIYPKDCLGSKNRHAFRKKQQRRLYRMGLFTNVKSKGRIGERAQVVKLSNRTKQWERYDNPHTQSKVFQIERKGTDNWYWMISHEPSEKSRVLVLAKCLKFRGRTGEYKIIYLQIRKKDIVIPKLIPEFITYLKNHKHGKNILDHLREHYITENIIRQKVLLKSMQEIL